MGSVKTAKASTGMRVSSDASVAAGGEVGGVGVAGGLIVIQLVASNPTSAIKLTKNKLNPLTGLLSA